MATSVDQNEKDLLAALDRVGDWQGKAFRYEPVKGGITNPNWKVVVDDSAFFVKIPGRGTEAFIDRRNCHAANLIAEKAGIGPRVCYFFEDTGVEIFEFMEGYRTLNYGDVYKRDLFYKIIEVARRFHQSNATLPLMQTAFDQTFKMFNMAKDLKAYLPPEINRMEWLARAIEDAILTAGIGYVPCHNDLTIANFIHDDLTGEMKLLDFEYASMNDPCFDFAVMSGARYFTEAMDVEWIRYYYGVYNEEKFARMKLYKIVADMKWAMWSLVQAVQSPIQGFDYFNWYGTKMARLRHFWNDPRLDYWINMVKGVPIF